MNNIRIRVSLLVYIALLSILSYPVAMAQKTPGQNTVKSLAQLQQEFVDLRFGMFIHFNIPTYMHRQLFSTRPN